MKNGEIALIAMKLGGVFWVMAATAIEEPEEKDGEFINYHGWYIHTNLRRILLMSKTRILPPIKE